MIVDMRTIPVICQYTLRYLPATDALRGAEEYIERHARKPDPTIASLAHCYIENVSYYDREVGHERMKTRIRAFSPCQEARRILSQR